MSKEKITIEKAPEHIFPLCPYCKAKLDKVWLKEQGIGYFGSTHRQFLICPKCNCLIGSGFKR